MKRVIFITHDDACYGFGLGGAVQVTAEPADVEAVVRRFLADPDNGLVVIDERLASAIPYERFREMERRWFGLLLTLPAPEHFVGEEEDYVHRIIRRTIGYHVRLPHE